MVLGSYGAGPYGAGPYGGAFPPPPVPPAIASEPQGGPWLNRWVAKKDVFGPTRVRFSILHLTTRSPVALSQVEPYPSVPSEPDYKGKGVFVMRSLVEKKSRNFSDQPDSTQYDHTVVKRGFRPPR